MATRNTLIHFFRTEPLHKTIFLEDEHNCPVLCDNDTMDEIHFLMREEAVHESRRLNALGIEGLDTHVIGLPFRICLKGFPKP